MTEARAKRLDLPADPSSVPEARRFVTQALQDWDLDGAVDVVALLVSELATNAVLHARTGYAVIVSADDDDVRVEVLDGSSVQPRRRQNSASAATGRGVALVDLLSSSWGSAAARHGYAKGVWFTVPVAGTSAATWDLADDA